MAQKMPIAILYTDGALKYDDLLTCQQEKWITLLVYRPRGQPDAPPTVILFESHDIALRFSFRNIPNGYLKGHINLTPEEMEWINGKGWKIEFLHWPRLMTNLPDIELGFEVLEFQNTPEVRRA